MTRRPATTERWAPFPVQDWQAYARTSRTWRSSRRTPMAVVVVTVAIVVVAALVLVAVDTPARSAGPGDSPYLPPDGESAVVSHVLNSDAAQLMSIGTAVLAAPLASQSVSQPLGTVLLGALRQDYATPVWRRTLVGSDRDTTELWSAGRDLRLLAVDSPTVLGYAGGVLVLPANAAPGQSWTSEGTLVSLGKEVAGTPWRSEFAASASATAGCLDLIGSIEVSSPHASVTELRQTWCPHRGPVSTTISGDGTTEHWAGTDDRPTLDIATAEARAVPVEDPRRELQDWQLSATPTVDRLPDGTVMPANGAPGSTLRATASGRAVVTASTDVLVLDPEDTQFVIRHRLHPGGALVATDTFGDVVVAATDRREVVAYDSTSGTELWRLTLPDISYATLRRLDDTTLLVASVNGTLSAVDGATGSVRWQKPVQFVTGFPATVGGGRAVFTDPGGDLVAVDAATGATVWQEPVDGTVDRIELGFDGSTVLAFTDLGLVARTLSDGSPLFQRRAGNSTTLALLPQTLVLAQPDVLVGITGDGHEAWRQPLGCDFLTPIGSLVACWQTTTVVVLDQHGTEVARQGLDPHIAQQLWATVAPDGLWWRANRPGPTGLSWQLHRWTAP